MWKTTLCVLGASVMACSGSETPETVATTEQAQLGDTYDQVTVLGFSQQDATFAFAEIKATSTDICAHTRVGECAISHCPNAQPPQDPLLDAGKITITGGAQPIELIPDPVTHAYGFGAFGPLLWQGGERITIKAEGSPQFRAFRRNVIAPTPIVMTAPAIPVDPNQTMTIPTTQDLAVQWTGGTTGYALLNFMREIPITGVPDATVGVTYVDCEFPAARGNGVVPASLLALLPKGQPGPGESNRISMSASSDKFSLEFARHVGPHVRQIGVQTFPGVPFMTQNVIFQ